MPHRRSVRGGNRPNESARVAVILDSDGLSKLARRDRRVREMIRQEVVVRGAVLVVPAVAVVQALAEGIGDAAIDEIVAGSEDSGADRRWVAIAASLLRATATTDVVDAIVAAEALVRVPSIIITSDPLDLRRLVDADPRGHRVVVWAV